MPSALDPITSQSTTTTIRVLSNGSITEKELNYVKQFNYHYNVWNGENFTYYEHLKKGYLLLNYIYDDLTHGDDLLHSVLLKEVSIVEDDEWQFEDLVNNILFHPIDYFPEGDFREDNTGEEEIDDIKEEITDLCNEIHNLM